MAWDRRGYYYRARKVNGVVRNEYVGTGSVAEQTAELDAIERQVREERRAAENALREQMEALDAPVAEFDELADRLARAALLAAGFHQHKRGVWRKRRERTRKDRD